MGATTRGRALRRLALTLVPLAITVPVVGSKVAAATPDQLFLVGESTDTLVGPTPVSYPTFTVTGTPNGLHIVAGAADTAFDLAFTAKTGATLAVGTYANVGPAPVPGPKHSFTITRGATACAAGSVGRLIIDQLAFRTVNGARQLSALVARWHYRCNGSAAASFGAITWKGTSAFRTRTMAPAAVSFGNQRFGWPSTTKTITITNRGPSRLTVTKVNLGGANANEFELLADRCTWVALTATHGCTLTVRYRPTHALGAHTATVTVFDELAPAGGTGYRIPLTGTAITFQGLYTPVTPVRIADSRTGLGFPLRKLAKGVVTNLQVTGRGGIPTSGVSAVVLNVVTTNASTSTVARAWAAGTPMPTTSFANPAPFRTRVQQITVNVGTGGKVSFVNTYGYLDLAVDAVGFYAALSGPKGLAYHPLTPGKLFDTRLGVGAFPPQQLASKHSLGVSLVRAFGGDPANLPKVVVLSVTAIGSTSNGSVNAFHYSAAKPPTPTYAPGTPAVAFNTGIQTSNLVTYSLDGGTQVWFYNNASGAVHLRVDVVGSFVTPTNGPDGVPTATGRFVPVTPIRLLDTRTPNAGGPVSVGTPRAVTVAPTASVPAGAIAIAGNLTTFAATGEADVAVHAADLCPAPDIVAAHTLPGFSVPVAVMPTLSLTTACSAIVGQFVTRGTSTAATPPQFQMVFDLAGWFRP